MSDRPNTPARSATRFATLVLLLAGLLGTAGPAAAQSPTPATTVKNSADNTRLQLNYDGGFYVPGTFIESGDPGTPADSIPATGASTRLMWYPAKAAFRAGRLFDNSSLTDGLDGTTFWNASNIGKYSVALGRNTKASGLGAVAMGTATRATGRSAVSMGSVTTASGFYATAIGQFTTAATNHSLTIGRFNDKNRGSDDNDPTTGPLFVVGNGSLGNPSDALVLDQSGTLEVSGGVVLPDGTTLEEGSDVSGLPTNGNGASLVGNDDGLVATGTFGSGSIPTTGSGTRMMWYPSKAAFRAGRVGVGQGKGDVWDADSIGDYSVALGVDTKAEASAAVAMGSRTTASRANATAMGSFTTASSLNATAMGQETTASGPAATAMGSGTTAATFRSLSIGECNDANSTSDNTLFAVGNGSYDLNSLSCSSTSDALVLDDQGNLTISGSLTQNSDRRLKTAVEPLAGDVLAKLADLRPVRYEFKNQKAHPAGEQLGLIAQDVQKEFPSLVREGSGDYLSLAYPKLAAVLLKGLQEQQAQIDRQQAQLDARDRRIAELEAENEAIKERLAALEAEVSSGGPAVAGLVGPWGLGLLLGLAGLGAGLLWRRRA
jgi:hypothetical protein